MVIKVNGATTDDISNLARIEQQLSMFVSTNKKRNWSDCGSGVDTLTDLGVDCLPTAIAAGSSVRVTWRPLSSGFLQMSKYLPSGELAFSFSSRRFHRGVFIEADDPPCFASHFAPAPPDALVKRRELLRQLFSGVSCRSQFCCYRASRRFDDGIHAYEKKRKTRKKTKLKISRNLRFQLIFCISF